MLILPLAGIAYVLNQLFGFTEPESLKLAHTELQVQVLLEDLEVPWDMDWSNDGWIWFSEKKGTISRYSPDSGELQLIHQIPDVYVSLDNSGLHALALHPEFPAQPYVYAHYTYAEESSRLLRLRYDSLTGNLEDRTILLDAIPANVSHNGSRIVFSPANDKLFLSIGDVYKPDWSMDPDIYAGKILRMNLDGSVPDDNPFPGSRVWSLGHRNPQGLVFAGNGHLYSSEHGSNKDDELNLILKGGDYGHPKVRGFCDRETEQEYCQSNDILEPLYAWTPTYGVAGIEYYDSGAIPEWRNSILVTSLKWFREKQGKRLQVLKLNQAGDQVTAVEDYLVRRFGRLREVMATPDGRVFLFTSNREHNLNKPRIPRLGDDRLIMLQAVNEDAPP